MWHESILTVKNDMRTVWGIYKILDRIEDILEKIFFLSEDFNQTVSDSGN